MKQTIKIENLKYFAPFSHRKIKDKYLIVNDWGDFLHLSQEEFDLLHSGKFRENIELNFKLKENNFLKKDLKLNQLEKRYRQKKSFLFAGPSLHIIVVTLRCNFSCLYCHASPRSINETEYDMSQETADKVLALAFAGNNPHLVLEFQGGEPLLNFSVVKYIIDQALKINKKKKKDLQIKLVTNGSLLDDKKLKYLSENNVSICISLDGPENLHNKQRVSQNKGNFNKIIAIIKKSAKEGQNKNSKQRINTLLTLTKNSLKFPKEIIDSHLALNIDNISLRPLHRYGNSVKNWNTVGYSANDFLKFYRQALDYILRLNKQGKPFQEQLAAVFLTKILTDRDPNHMDYRSPCGAGIGQLAYNYNGDIYTCDEGRMISMMGDELFRLGNVYENTYQEIVNSSVTKAMCAASCVESLPACEQCAYKPFCGVCPVFNYTEQGNIFAKTPDNERCRQIKGILDYLFEKMMEEKNVEIFLKWISEKSSISAHKF